MNKTSQTWLTVLLAVVILGGAGFFVIHLIGQTKAEATATVTDRELVITGQYGASYPLTAIGGARLEDDLPAITRKIDGAGLDSSHIYKGLFELEGLGEATLYIQGDQAPYLYIDTEIGPVIINFPDPAKTRSLYDELTAALP